MVRSAVSDSRSRLTATGSLRSRTLWILPAVHRCRAARRASLVHICSATEQGRLCAVYICRPGAPPSQRRVDKQVPHESKRHNSEAGARHTWHCL
eukprot:4942306-Prymnesium_polylepis.1